MVLSFPKIYTCKNPPIIAAYSPLEFSIIKHAKKTFSKTLSLIPDQS